MLYIVSNCHCTLDNGRRCHVQKLDYSKGSKKMAIILLLRISSPELKRTFREAERLKEKIIKLKTHLKFNKTCLIYIYSSVPVSS